MGTLGGALEARGIEASGGLLTCEATGEVEVDGGVLVLKRIHARYQLRGDGIDRRIVERVHGFHRERCPVARSIGAAIEITTSYEVI
jgi:uncharacterized OsmC-like protein